MIRFLSIQRLAIIDQLELEFGPGFTVLTGETGAGKSILMEAVGLLLGGRAAADLVRTGADSALVQAAIETPDGEELLVRREVSAQGRSRAFIDGALVPSSVLRDTVGALVDIHGQHEHQGLLQPQTQLDLLDTYADSEDQRARAGDNFRELSALREELLDVQGKDRDRGARADLLTFQRGEIDKVAPKPGEDEELAAQRQVLANADKLNRLCAESYSALYEDDSAVLAGLTAIWKRVGELATLDTRFAPYVERRNVVQSELEELAFFLRDYASSLDASPERLQQVEDRLAQLERLKRRYGPTLSEVLEKRQAIDEELNALDTSADRAAALERRIAEARARYVEIARTLSGMRRDAGRRLGRALEQSLEELAMASTRCDVRVTSLEADESGWTETGFDRVELYLSANVGEDLRPLARIASGGELSRIMLALKTLASTDAPGKTLIFDEVDAGIGGRVADVVGSRLRALAGECQVFCITHLPQVAAYGQSHFLVSKHTVRDRTVTAVELLKNDRRVEEIARMMGGREITPKVLAGAQDMLLSRHNAKAAPNADPNIHGEAKVARGAKAKGESESRQKAKAKESR
jgi:DNA repair protein RecN (Recombination protein N)